VTPDKITRRMFALLRDAGISQRSDRLKVLRAVLFDPGISSTNELDYHDIATVCDVLAYWQRDGQTADRIARILASTGNPPQC